MAILVISVNTQCCRCEEKINKILACLRGKYCIEKIEHEEKGEKVIVRGSFCAEKLRKKIWRKAGCKIITDIIIVEVWPPISQPSWGGGCPLQCNCCPKPPTTTCEGSRDSCHGGSCKPPPPPPPPCTCGGTGHGACSYGGGCSLQCNCCPKPPTTPTCEGSRDSCHGGCCKRPPPPPPPPCTCGGCSGHGDCAYGGGRPPIINCPTSPWPPQPPFCQPPWGGCKVVCEPEASACTVM
ncbi:hypothetical protein ABZP36_003842 [Zizania latifolia]